jgi:hypothetical protein
VSLASACFLKGLARSPNRENIIAYENRHFTFLWVLLLSSVAILLQQENKTQEQGTKWNIKNSFKIKDNRRTTNNGKVVKTDYESEGRRLNSCRAHHTS